MKIGTIFKNIVYRALCIFQLSGSIFWMLYSTETSIGHKFCNYGVKPRSTGPFTAPKKHAVFHRFWQLPACPIWVVLRLNKVFWLTQHPNNGKALLFQRSGIYIVQQTGIKIVKRRDWYERLHEKRSKLKNDRMRKKAAMKIGRREVWSHEKFDRISLLEHGKQAAHGNVRHFPGIYKWWANRVNE